MNVFLRWNHYSDNYNFGWTEPGDYVGNMEYLTVSEIDILYI